MKLFLYIILFILLILTSIIFSLTAPLSTEELEMGMRLTPTEESIHNHTRYMFVLLSLPILVIAYYADKQIRGNKLP